MTERTWSWRHAILKSNLPPTTRHLLLTISCFMNEVGGGCYPTQEQLAAASGLTRRSVGRNIAIAAAAGWLTVSEHGFRGQKWRNHEYVAAWPDPLPIVVGSEKGGDTESHPFSEAGDFDDKKVGTQSPTILPDHPSISLANARENASAMFEKVWTTIPRRPDQSKRQAQNEFMKLNENDQEQCLAGATIFAKTFASSAKARKETIEQAKSYLPTLAKWIMERRWEGTLPTDADEFVVLRRDTPDFDEFETRSGRRLTTGRYGGVTLRRAEVERTMGRRVESSVLQ